MFVIDGANGNSNDANRHLHILGNVYDKFCIYTLYSVRTNSGTELMSIAFDKRSQNSHM